MKVETFLGLLPYSVLAILVFTYLVSFSEVYRSITPG